MVSSADPKGEYITASVKRKNKNDGSHTSVSLEDTPSTLTNRGVSSQSLVEQDKATTSAPPLIFVKSDDIQLSIRMPSGNRLEIKVTKQDVLRKVKNFVDENKGNELSSYDLSLVYPKRVFSEQARIERGEMGKQRLVCYSTRGATVFAGTVHTGCCGGG
uniref:UBX domain-containing protein n=1 Tax=Sorghum bicolor TaxID=4558 RepID=C6JRH8_SORBI